MNDEPIAPHSSGGPERLVLYLERLFEQVFWADRRVLELLRSSPAAGENEDAARLLAHLLAAERVWLLRLLGEDGSVQPIWPELTLEEMEAMSTANRTGYTRFLAALTEPGLEREAEYRNSTGAAFRTRVVDVLTHVALHGSHHRGQVARAVRAIGVAPVNTDYITYVREQP